MTLSQRAVEAAARAIWRSSVYQGYNEETREHEWIRMEGIWKRQAEAAITAALAVDGMCLVPCEPTQEMLDAALALDAVSHGVLVPAGPADVWTAMIAAANDGEDSTRQEKI